MNKKNWWALSVIILTFLLTVTAAIWYEQKDSANNLQGKLVFAKTYNDGSRVNKIVISSKDGYVILKQENSYWLLENGGMYFADFRLIHSLLSTVNQSIYMMKIPYDAQKLSKYLLHNPEKQKENSGVLIKTYVDEKILDEIIIGREADTKKYFYVMNPKNKDIWLADGNFNLPLKPEEWLLNPVLSVPKNAVESVTIAKSYVQREKQAAYFFNEKGNRVFVEPLLNILYALNIVSAEKQKPEDEPARVIDVITFYGLEYIIKLYNKDNKIWAKIDLTTTSLPKSQVKEYINENSFLYEGWLFEIAPGQAHVLRDFKLE